MEASLNSPIDILEEPLASDLRNLNDSYPKLGIRMTTSGIIALEGDLDIYADGKFIDRFAIRIEISNNYPVSIPKVFEVGGRIPRIADRHVNPDGSACLFVPDSRWRHWPIGADLVEFISGAVRYYFLAQAFFDLEGTWLFGERPHGDDGVIDYYREELRLKDLGAIYRCLKIATTSRSLDVLEDKSCPCGSGPKLRVCHKEMIERIRANIPSKRLNEVMAMLKRQR